MNRPPQPADPWFAEHQMTCGGKYTKISAPDPKPKKLQPSSKRVKEESSVPTAPRSRTMLDDFLAGKLSKATKTMTPVVSSAGISSSSSTTTTTTSVSPSKTRTAAVDEGIVDEKDAKKHSQLGTLEEPKSAAFLDSDSTQGIQPGQGQSIVGPGPEIILTDARLSPMQAAANAALARFEKKNHINNINKSKVINNVEQWEQLQSLSPLHSSKDRNSSDEAVSFKDEDGTGSPPQKRFKITQPTTDTTQVEVEVELQSDKMPSSASSLPSSSSSFARSIPSTADPPNLWVTTKTVEQQKESCLSPTVMVECPVCSQQVPETTINDHVDLCLWRTSGEANT
ncbi:hypothetical protein BG004_008077 [Podila humilis]|nr:hypothetical protein BG004_008077 [Podila humilis]